jgi:AcrR family transcriptional regulator
MSEETAPTPETGSPVQSPRDRIMTAFMALLSEKPIESMERTEIAKRADVSLADLRAEFSSPFAILAAKVKEIDRAVLDGAVDGSVDDMVDEPPRERLFDVLMRRIEALEPHKAAIRSLMNSATRDPALAIALNGLTVRSQQWMLAAADISTSGPKGAVRAQGLALLFASVLRTWLNDDDPGHARTMAALDRALGRGQRLAAFLDDILSIPARLCRARPRLRRKADEDAAAA